jgi:hypothetical protein
MQSVPIPGDVWRTTVAFGLTFKELMILISAPFSLMLPIFYVPFIPPWATVVFGVVSAVTIVLIGIRTPDGQRPLEWIPAFIQQRFAPSTYYIQPDQQYRARPRYIDTVLTADQIKTEADGSASVADIRESEKNGKTPSESRATAKTTEESNPEQSAHQSAGSEQFTFPGNVGAVSQTVDDKNTSDNQ